MPLVAGLRVALLCAALAAFGTLIVLAVVLILGWLIFACACLLGLLLLALLIRLAILLLIVRAIVLIAHAFFQFPSIMMGKAPSVCDNASMRTLLRMEQQRNFISLLAFFLFAFVERCIFGENFYAI